MRSTVFDAAIFRDTVATPAMRAIISDEGLVRRHVEVDVVMAKADACGMALVSLKGT